MASASSKETEECIRLVFEAVNKNSFSLLRKVKNTYSGIQLLTSLAECNEKGETPLAIAIKSNYVFVVKEMMKFLIDVPDNVEHQLKSTFVINQLLRQIPIKQLIDTLIHEQFKPKWLMFISKIIIESNSLTQEDKIILLEVFGAALITRLCLGNFDEGDLEEALCGLECWREAMSLRYFPTEDGDDPLPKLPNVHVPSVLSSVIFGSAVEVATREELDLLQQDFERNYLTDVGMRIPCVKRMVIQALLVIRRISAQEHLGHPHWFYLQSLLGLAGFFREFEDRFHIKIYLFILEELNGFDPNLFSLRSFELFITTLSLVSYHFVSYLTVPQNSPEGRDLNYANLLMITKLSTKIQFNHPYFENSGNTTIQKTLRVNILVYHLVFILNSISSRMTSEEQLKLEKLYCDFFHDFPERTTTVLHGAVLDNIWDSTNYERLQTIQRLLQFGADPNAIDENGRNPLHFLATVMKFKEDESVPFFQVLLDAGAHLDVATDDGKTVLCILKENLEGKVHPYFESLINSALPLSCYCVRVIRRHGVPFEDRLSPRLKKLISIHNAIEASIDLHQPRPGSCSNYST